MKIRPSKIRLCSAIVPAALFSLSTLTAFAAAPTAAPASAAVSVSAPGTAAAALDKLIGKPQIIGVTEKNGTKFLGRVLSGDHTHYAFRAFHFTGPSQTTNRAYGSGRNRRAPRVKTPTYIPDVQAVKLLLAGAAGAKTNPPETPTGSGILAASDIKYLQALSPPAKSAKESKAAVPKLSAGASRWAWTLTTLWPSAADKGKSKT